MFLSEHQNRKSTIILQLFLASEHFSPPIKTFSPFRSPNGPLQQTTWQRVPARPLELRKAALRFSTPCSPILYHDGLAIRQRQQGRVAWGGGVLKHSERHALRIPHGAAKFWKGCKEVWGALVVGHHQQHQMQWQSVFVLKRQQMSASEYNVPSSSSLASECPPFRNEVKR